MLFTTMFKTSANRIFLKERRLFQPNYVAVVAKYCYHDMPFTADTYKVARGNYEKINSTDITVFQDMIGAKNVLTDPDDIAGNNVDWIKTVRGQSSLLLKPRTTEEVSSIMKYCHERTLAVCPQGGNTGLVGGSVPVFDEIILSTIRMQDILSIDAFSGVLECQAGCVLERANDAVSEHDMIIPLDLGAKGSCHLGGNLSTNAGGLRLLRYGSLRGSTLGVEAVLADGTVLDCLQTLRKDNTGYDLKQLMIGSEGTLGIITKLAILCPQKPSAVNLSFLGANSFQDLLLLLKEARKQLGEILSAVEFMDSECMRLTTSNLGLKNPISDHSFYMLIETSGSNFDHDEEKLASFLSNILESGLASDGTLATDSSKILEIWALRERMAEAILHDGYNFKYDMSFKADVMYNMVEDTRKHLAGKVKSVVGYGHIGDGNLHLNITVEKNTPEVTALIEPFVYEWTSANGGSVSAEHGLGFKKRQYIEYTKKREAVLWMKKIKHLFDPKNILNPYKTMPDN